MHPQNRGHTLPRAADHSPDVVRNRVRRVNAAPAKELRAPRRIRILAVGEEIRVEKTVVQRDCRNHLAPVQAGCRTNAKHVLRAPVAAVIGLVPATVEMPHSRSKINTHGVDSCVSRRSKVTAHTQQLAANRADPGVQITRLYQARYEPWLQYNVRIQG